ncbi:hypothetical protein [Synechococcus sp. UW105]|uniref:hypothetical protein n=1 Tax=Synechococcus sp. UW105 TaxID=337067 RepID=UPI001FCB3F96|nr:hypothetical protein [Synechococcus sp. UW105]
MPVALFASTKTLVNPIANKLDLETQPFQSGQETFRRCSTQSQRTAGSNAAMTIQIKPEESAATMSSNKISQLIALMVLFMAATGPGFANIKDEFERSQACSYFDAEFVSDVGVFDDIKVRFCISDDKTEVIYVLDNGTSWVVPFEREYRENGVLSLNTLEDGELIRYQKSKGVVKRKVLGRKRSFQADQTIEDFTRN